MIYFSVHADVRLPQLVSSGMVLQRDARINIWGWANADEKVNVTFRGSYHTIADKDGRWKIVLPAMKAGGPYIMEIKAANNIVLNDILIGDVWFCSGQSNMVLPMDRVKEKYPNEIASANYPQIRNFFIKTEADVTKIHDDLLPGKWIKADPESVLNFGAVSWFFAQKLYQKYHVPIGIINSSVGGTPIQAWISENGLKANVFYSHRAAWFHDPHYMDSVTKVQPEPVNPANTPKYDKGLNGNITWFDTAYVPHNWHHFWLPGYWADQGIKNLNGVVWFRKEVILPAGVEKQQAKLLFGRMIDADQTYVNGTLVGNITYQYPPRRYNVPVGLLKPGKNIIVVRLTNFAGKGGFVPDKAYNLKIGTQVIDLRGDWLYQVGQVFLPTDKKASPVFTAQNEATGLYNAMVAPAINYTIKGMLWYQGESNADKPAGYGELLTALVTNWRQQWQQGNLPFIYAQLPNFNEVQYLPTESNWALIREGQLKALSQPNTGMAITIDAGEWNDIHPLDKKDVGERLARAAEHIAYGEKGVVASGPIFQSALVQGNNIAISFKNIGEGLIAHDGDELEQFAIAGANKKFIWAKAKIEGDKVIVWSDEVPNPLYVRYAWADNPEEANLYNKEGLPASPFRTDNP
ncbi:sialate O-acetylesterase [Mucilaginibacter sp. FT3.2]|uniref:sialate O-acetylesterase n=1 Tax=Mucilaginibacter sp. FT3.2 TaxID=2723090 RepID=UPI00181AD9CC|nr:sialate O-acetylesterase [Mucilaginibacter sp. FT3.2]MBB6229827.1 sialate O-acetylesterase [Mucilaginibacter sp. FT3.2]